MAETSIRAAVPDSWTCTSAQHTSCTTRTASASARNLEFRCLKGSPCYINNRQRTERHVQTTSVPAIRRFGVSHAWCFGGRPCARCIYDILSASQATDKQSITGRCHCLYGVLPGMVCRGADGSRLRASAICREARVPFSVGDGGVTGCDAREAGACAGG